VADADETAIGLMPKAGKEGIDTDGVDVTPEAMAHLLEVDPEEWRKQLPQMKEYLAQFGDHLPDELHQQLESLESRLDV
jgi:phosphoenolpyruvate carboxykinase (GTP)